MGTKRKIRVLLADDHAVLREGLRTLLELEGDIDVVSEAEDGRRAVELAKIFKPAVVVMDIGMPLLNGLEATRHILYDSPDTKIIILSAHNDDIYIDQVLSVGASGYLLKQSSSETISKAIREVSKGETCFCPSVSKRIRTQYDKSPIPGKLLRKRNADLTSRELEVIQLVAEGFANKQIADELAISVKTVEKHRQQLKKKLNIQDTAGLTRYAISAGIVQTRQVFPTKNRI